MNCELEYCIYNDMYTCILDEIQINSYGMCEDCELITIPKEKLEKYKKQRLNKIFELSKNCSDLI